MSEIYCQPATHTLSIKVMATKTVHVCDICGKEANARRTIDVCTQHSVSGSTRIGSQRAQKPRRATKSAARGTRSGGKVKCPECGKTFKNQAGLNIHTSRAHKK